MTACSHPLRRSPAQHACRRAPMLAVLLLFALPLAALLGGCKEGDSDRIRESVYVEIAGTRIATDAWLPEGAGPDMPVPAVLRPTTSWRDFDMRLRPGIDRPIGWTADRWNEAGYAFVFFDAKGTGASFGAAGPRDPAMDRVIGHGVVDWIVEQPWSSGQVALWGEQDDARLVEPMLAEEHPAIGAGILRYADWDLRAHRHAPGGILLEPVIEERIERAGALDVGDPCGFSPRDCDEVAPVFLGPRPVADDPDGSLRDAAIEEHDVVAMREHGAPRVEGEGSSSQLEEDATSPHLLADRLSGAGVPTQLWAGWWDSETADAALRRYAEVRAPQMLIIGAFGPGGATRAAPGLREPIAAVPSATEQFATMAAFVDRHMLDQDRRLEGEAAADEAATMAGAGAELFAGARRETAGAWSRVNGFALEITGEGWLEGSGAPPVGEDLALALTTEGSLVPTAGGGPATNAGRRAPVGEAATPGQLLTHEVDFDVGTGAFGRYLGRLESRLAWPDRTAEDERLLFFDADSLTEDLRILGRPRLDLELGFEIPLQGDPGGQVAALHAYLDAVAPSGRVDLLSEGHLFLEGGRLQSREIEMSPIGIRVPAGMRLRLTLAGHDKDAFERIPPQGNVQWRIEADLSRLSIPTLGEIPSSSEASGD